MVEGLDLLSFFVGFAFGFAGSFIVLLFLPRRRPSLLLPNERERILDQLKKKSKNRLVI